MKSRQGARYNEVGDELVWVGDVVNEGGVNFEGEVRGEPYIRS